MPTVIPPNKYISAAKHNHGSYVCLSRNNLSLHFIQQTLKTEQNIHWNLLQDPLPVLIVKLLQYHISKNCQHHYLKTVVYKPPVQLHFFSVSFFLQLETQPNYAFCVSEQK